MRKMNLSLRSTFFYLTSLCVVCTTLWSGHSVVHAEKNQIAEYSVAVVGREVITHKDVLDRLELAMKFLGKVISEKNFDENYTQTLQTLIDEARQRQGPKRYLALVKKAYKTQYARLFGPEAVQKDVKERLEKLMTHLGQTEAEFRSSLGPLYHTFYQRELANITFQVFLRFRHGHSAINRSLASKAIVKARAKWMKQRGQKQYRISEIVVYNRNLALSQSTMALVSSALNDGASFAMVASEYSQAPSRDQNGDYGWHALEHFGEPIQAFLKTAEIGDMSAFIPLPTARNPQKWVKVLLTDHHQPDDKNVGSKGQKDPGNEFFQSIVFSEELERLAKDEMENLRKNFPCVVHRPKNLKMPRNFGGQVTDYDSGSSEGINADQETDQG